MEGIVKAISVKNKSILLGYDEEGTPVENWFKLGLRVKPEYVKKGSCEFNGDLVKKFVSFIKCEGSQEEYPEESPSSSPSNNSSERDEIKRMSALKTASKIYEGAIAVHGIAIEEDFKKLVGNIGYFIETGGFK